MARARKPVAVGLALLSLLILSSEFPVPCAFAKEHPADDPHRAFKSDLTTEEKEKSTADANDLCVQGEPGAALRRAACRVDSQEAKRCDSSNEAAGGGRKVWDAAYREAMEKEREAYEMARDTLTEAAKTSYEVAKERTSQATGDLGAEMLRQAGL